MKHILLLFFLFLSIPVFAQQTYLVQGTVVDANDKTPLPGSTVMLTRLPDSTKAITITNAAGQFRFNPASGHYLLKISFLGYQKHQQRVEVKQQPVLVGAIGLSPDAKSLNEVKVVGQIPPATQKGDTTEFNAAAFKTNPDANADDLVEKMPGVVIDGGKVQAQGENIRRVLVDGKTFFGDDAIATLKNLPAEIIDKVQIYDEISEEARLSGVDDGEVSKTMNIITKPNMRNGTFGKVYGGVGNDDRYNTGFNLNNFKGDRRLTVMGQSNTINQQNFSSVDLLGVMGNGGGRKRERQSDNSNRNNRTNRGGNGGGGGGGIRGANDFLVPEMGGITQTHALGLNYTDRWGKNIRVSGSYFGNYTDNEGFENSYRQYFGNQRFDNQQERETATSRNTNHRANFRFEYQLDSANSLFMEPSMTLQFNNGFSDDASESFFTGKKINETTNHSASELLAYSFSNQLLFRHEFRKRGRSVSVGVRMSANQNAGDEYFLADTRTYRKVETQRLLNQFKTLDMNGWSFGPSLSYTEPIGKISQLQLSYRGNFQQNDSEKLTYNYQAEEADYTGLDTLQSNTFYNDNFSHQFGLGFRLRYKEFNLSARGSYQYSEQNNERIFPQYQSIGHAFHNAVPNLTLRYNITKQKNLRLLYFGNTNNPSVEQLQNVLTINNPLQLRIGNPDLQQFYRHALTFQYTVTNKKNFSNFHTGLTGMFTQNQVANNRIINNTDDTIYVANIPILPTGQITRPVNLDGGQNLRTFISYGLPIKPIKTNLNLDFTADYGRMPGILNDTTNFNYTQNYGLGITLSSNISENLDFTVSSRSGYNLSTSTLPGSINNTFFTQRNRVRLTYQFWKNLVFQTDLTQRLNTGQAVGFNQNRALWNLSLGKKFLKRNAGDLRFTVFDALNQNNSINRRVSNAFIEDVETRVLQRYYMVTFTYNVRRFGPGGPARNAAGPGKNKAGKEKQKAGKQSGGKRTGGFGDEW